MGPASLHPRTALLLAGLLLGACEPIQSETLLRHSGTPDADEALPGQGPVTCWQERELARNVQNLAFTFDAQGVGSFAFNQGSKVYLGSTRPGDVVRPVDGVVGSVVDLVVDARGRRHLLLGYGSMSSYAHEQGGTWVHTEVAPGSYPVRLKLDTSGFVHLLLEMEGGTAPRLSYATNQSGAWELTDLGAVALDGSENLARLELDARSKPHIAYCGVTDHHLHYASNASGEWVREEVESSGCSPAFVLEVGGLPSLLFGSCRVTRQEGGWERVCAGAGPGVDADSVWDLKVDGAGHFKALGATYRPSWPQGGELVYASLLPRNEGWRTTPILPLDAQSPYSALRAAVLGLDAEGLPHVGYWVTTFADSGAWTTTGNVVKYARPLPCPFPGLP